MPKDYYAGDKELYVRALATARTCHARTA